MSIKGVYAHVKHIGIHFWLYLFTDLIGNQSFRKFGDKKMMDLSALKKINKDAEKRELEKEKREWKRLKKIYGGK